MKELCSLRLSENRMLRRIFGPRRDEATESKRLNDYQLYDLYCSINIIRVIKSRRMICWACSRYGGEKRCIKFW